MNKETTYAVLMMRPRVLKDTYRYLQGKVLCRLYFFFFYNQKFQLAYDMLYNKNAL